MDIKTKAAIGGSVFVALIAGTAIGQTNPDEGATEPTTVATTVTRTVTADPTLQQRKDARAKLRDLRSRATDARADASSAARRERRSRSELRELKAQISTTSDQVAMSSFEGDGTFVVNEDILPGTYRAAASPGCYWETGRGSGAETLDNIIANDNTDGPVVVQITPDTYQIKVARCSTFERTG
ncbi:hypothetical protein [Patulibacter sp.]|uniref:hypothetical protein n=1 Tax=Patulibacter sp. TaxID=1912859 RepID=UPI002725B125|nr:hypothetical protein [Patulibacter sp.]MDO9410064.1 hypothetical protein [Patulibacter sp.]